ncbi:MAG: TonB-dependent receptor plug domain-containing protein, partial [Maribacter sp.]|nr:TonB-dependent receptor plug domain-containing protein [Maribacter sp.]
MLLKRLSILILYLLLISFNGLSSQTAQIKGIVTEKGIPIPYANIFLTGTNLGTSSLEDGTYRIQKITPGSYRLNVSVIGFQPYSKKLVLGTNETQIINIELFPNSEQLEETVVTGTLKAVKRSESPVPVEVYSPTFLKKNPTASVFEALQNVNGVRPQINCNVCNTGDIHINGLEGPYTLVLIDGMPIVSGLGTVYGLSGIPNSL